MGNAQEGRGSHAPVPDAPARLQVPKVPKPGSRGHAPRAVDRRPDGSLGRKDLPRPSGRPPGGADGLGEALRGGDNRPGTGRSGPARPDTGPVPDSPEAVSGAPRCATRGEEQAGPRLAAPRRSAADCSRLAAAGRTADCVAPASPRRARRALPVAALAPGSAARAGVQPGSAAAGPMAPQRRGAPKAEGSGAAERGRPSR